METGFIYLVTNLLNGMVYVGLTSKTVERRWSVHRSTAIRPTKRTSRSYLHRSMRKYGIENFKIETLEEVPVSELSECEKKWIAKYDSANPEVGYNLTLGGEKPVHTAASRSLMSAAKKGKYVGENNHFYGKKLSPEHIELIRKRTFGNKNMLGKTHSPETREKISKAVSGRVWSPEERSRRSATVLKGADNPLFGKPLSEETRAKMSAAKTGTKRSAAECEAIRAFHKGRKRSPETIERLRQAALNRPKRGSPSPEVLAKMKAAQKKRREDEATNGVVINSARGEKHHLFGKQHPEETRAKMKAYWESRRNSKAA